ncbi:MAG: hypothetical protein RL701_5458 [Pseudomonadota bacterium]|jgi:hypothetical protein
MRSQTIVGHDRDETFARSPPAEIGTLRLIAADEAAAVQHDQQRTVGRGLGPIHVESMTLVRPIHFVDKMLHARARLLRKQRRVQRRDLRQVKAWSQDSQLRREFVRHTAHNSVPGSL